jgi:hypothetical protein
MLFERTSIVYHYIAKMLAREAEQISSNVATRPLIKFRVSLSGAFRKCCEEGDTLSQRTDLIDVGEMMKHTHRMVMLPKLWKSLKLRIASWPTPSACCCMPLPRT